MKRLYIAVVLIAAAALAFAGGNQESASSSGGSAGGPVKLVTTYWGGATKVNAFKASAAAFTKENPNVSIDLINIPNADYSSKIISMVAANTAPDVINVSPGLFITLKDQLLPLTNKLQDYGYFDPKNGLWSAWFDKLVPSGHYKKGDQVYLAPLGTGSDVLAYNKKLFDAAGVSYPTDSWTWTGDFLQAAMKLTHDGQYAITGFPFRGTSILIPLAKAFGGDVYDTQNERFVGDNPNTIAAFQFAQDLIYKYKVHPTPSEEQALGGAQGGVFQNQKAAMYIMPTFQFPPFFKSDFPWDVSKLPRGTNGSWSSIYGGLLGVYAKTKAPDMAFNFINLINGPVGQKYFSIDSGFNTPPLKKIAYSDAFMKGPEGAPAHNSVRVTVLEQSVDPQPVLPNGDKINDVWKKYLPLFWENKIDAAGLMSKLKSEIQPLLDQR